MPPDITIPPEALEAGKKVLRDLLPPTVVFHDDLARACFLAMVKAWPGMEFVEGVYCGKPYTDIILPLTEKPDAP